MITTDSVGEVKSNTPCRKDKKNKKRKKGLDIMKSIIRRENLKGTA